MHSNFTSNTEANFNDSPASSTDFVPVNTAPGTYFAGIRTANGASAIVGKSGNGGIAPYVKATTGTISYVESSFASKYGLKSAAMETKSKLTSGVNKGKPNYLLPSTSYTVAALTAHAAVVGQDPINPTASYVQPVFATGTSSYPIVGYSWLLVYKNFEAATSATVGKGQVQGLVAFLNWALTSGQTSTYQARGYVPLPASVRTTAIAELKTITWEGTAVWPYVRTCPRSAGLWRGGRTSSTPPVIYWLTSPSKQHTKRLKGWRWQDSSYEEQAGCQRTVSFVVSPEPASLCSASPLLA